VNSVLLSAQKIQKLGIELYYSGSNEIESTLKDLELEAERFWHLKQIEQSERPISENN
jgi:hypothetical protein